MDTSTSGGDAPTGTAPSTLWSRLSAVVNHENVLVRFVASWVVFTTLFVAAWYVGYYLLPEGVLRGAAGVGARTPYLGNVRAEFLSILGFNLLFALVLVGANTFRSVETPLGHLVLLVTFVQGGLVWGSNSLVIQAGRLEPSLAVALGRSGLYELTAFVAIAVATRGVMLWHQRSGPRWREEFERVRSVRDWHVSLGEWVMLLAGLVLLAGANYVEAVRVAAVGG
ncbi:hypothetical protein N0B31_01625 [Salinirubellus salinus]|uniref:Uncharacterized protein n=1 Tax=Salinirubellus salinus TaxID=1364945 RepID=A0A9E7U8M4_9EURY|nr:hypothetical protein [Salinirubellus salinus]UWM54991.1 hypothetical protein N0B31_01625 [Salinirubellus salinus]